MPSIKYLGPTSDDLDLVTRLRLQSEIAGEVTPASVDQQITDALTSKSNSFYLSNASSQRVSPSAISGKGSALINTSTQVNVPGGPVVLSGGRIPDSFLPNSYDRPGGKGWNKVSEFTNANLTLTTGVWNSTSERQIGSFQVPGPSFSWFPIFSGDFTLGGGKGEICIKQGSRYVARAISGNLGSAWWTCSIIPLDSLISYTGSVTFTVTQRSFFGSTDLGGGFRIACLAVPA